MSKKEEVRSIVYSDGSVGDTGDFPIAVSYSQVVAISGNADGLVVDPIFNDAVYNNLYGRMMTLVEATTEAYKLKAVKDLFSKELQSWSNDVFDSAREIATGGNSSNNLYTRGQKY